MSTFVKFSQFFSLTKSSVSVDVVLLSVQKKFLELFSWNSDFLQVSVLFAGNKFLSVYWGSRIIEPLASRCAKFRFKPLLENVMQNRIQYICQEEGLKLDQEVCVSTLNHFRA